MLRCCVRGLNLSQGCATADVGAAAPKPWAPRARRGTDSGALSRLSALHAPTATSWRWETPPPALSARARRSRRRGRGGSRSQTRSAWRSATTESAVALRPASTRQEATWWRGSSSRRRWSAGAGARGARRRREREADPRLDQRPVGEVLSGEDARRRSACRSGCTPRCRGRAPADEHVAVGQRLLVAHVVGVDPQVRRRSRCTQCRRVRCRSSFSVSPREGAVAET